MFNGIGLAMCVQNRLLLPREFPKPSPHVILPNMVTHLQCIALLRYLWEDPLQHSDVYLARTTLAAWLNASFGIINASSLFVDDARVAIKNGHPMELQLDEFL